MSKSKALEMIEELLEENAEFILISSDKLISRIKEYKLFIRIYQQSPYIVKLRLTEQTKFNVEKKTQPKANWKKQELINMNKSGLAK